LTNGDHPLFVFLLQLFPEATSLLNTETHRSLLRRLRLRSRLLHPWKTQSQLGQVGESCIRSRSARHGRFRRLLLHLHLHLFPSHQRSRLRHGHNGDVRLFDLSCFFLTSLNLANPLLSATPMPGTSALPSSPPPRAGLFGKIFAVKNVL